MKNQLTEETPTIEVWEDCYNDGWQGLIVPEAFSHPAKMARGLVVRIFDELFAMGALQKGDLVLDPFAGIGSTLIEGASRGLNVVGVELEPKFVTLAKQNIDLHRYAWEAMGCPPPVILQGDSRQLRKVLRMGEVDCVVGSPPYMESEVLGGSHENGMRGKKPGKHANQRGDYGQTEGQLGSMKAGSVEAVIGSPPYIESLERSGGIDPTRSQHIGGPHSQMNRSDTRYGPSEGQLSAMRPGSVDAVVSSPPYSERHAYPDEARNEARAEKLKAGGAAIGGTRGLHKPSGEHPDNLAQKQGPTFWSAARDILLECHVVLKPRGYAVWVVKGFVRKKQIVDFPDDWLSLCESCGFTLVKRVQASLIKEDRHPDLFQGETVKRKERKSFFRRLSERKGSPRIDYEEVIFVGRTF